MRLVCGTTAATGNVTVTVTVHDADSNRANTDRAQVTFTITLVNDIVPTFGAATAADKTHLANSAIDAFQIPQATGGNGTLGALPREQALDVDDALRLDLMSAFKAAPGEALTFRVESSDPAVARVRVECDELVVEALAEGTATVTATDAAAQVVMLRFEVVVTAAVRSQWHGWRTILLDSG